MSRRESSDDGAGNPDGQVPDRLDEYFARWHQAVPSLDADEVVLVALMARMRRATAIIDRELVRIVRGHGMQLGECEVLMVLRNSGTDLERTPSELARRLMVSPGGMTNRLDSLERAGLVTRVVNPDNRRSISVFLTERGAALAEGVMHDCTTQLSAMLHRYSSAQRTAFELALRELFRELTDRTPGKGERTP